MKHGLPLPPAAIQIAFAAILFDLSNVPLDGEPSLDLPVIFFRQSPAQVITAIPLKPAARVRRVNPPLLFPYGKRLAGIHAEIIQLWVMHSRAELSFFVPIGRKLFPAIGHVFPAKDTQFEHFLWSKLRLEPRIKILSRLLRERIPTAFLHLIVNMNDFFLHKCKKINRQKVKITETMPRRKFRNYISPKVPSGTLFWRGIICATLSRISETASRISASVMRILQKRNWADSVWPSF